jgi:malonate-semialdehyde dehydrogenase (acetylating)/methylmalonate-semialdehyde dehydrogenase
MVPMWMHPVAIACGNAFVLKPSERDPSVSAVVARLWQEAGLPDGVFNVVHGDKVAVDAILDHPGIAAVSFVGSTPIARYIHQKATSTGKRVQALGGAKNHAIVLPDADLDFASDHLVASAFGSAGERCMAISATVAVGPAADALVEVVSEKAGKVTVGAGRDAGSEMGPVVTAEAKRRIEGLIGAGQRQGARVAVDGRGLVVPGYEQGFFVGPTVLDAVTPEMEVYQEEIFGPVLSVLTFEDEDEAIRIANDVMYGLAATVWTTDLGRAFRVADKIDAGIIWTNCPHYLPVNVPYEGHKMSGLGEDLGVEALQTFTHLKTHCINFNGGKMAWA